MAWIKLTNPAGIQVLVSTEQMVRVRIPHAGEVDPAANSIVDFANGQFQAVRETSEQVLTLLCGQTGCMGEARA
ncbi:MAG: hypothetical protein P4M07_14215 [Xanthobacteraceae bacterium]|nr:hypothetical protein [Xanthobacteraceae bacterium]